jgi:hypothetical protein
MVQKVKMFACRGANWEKQGVAKINKKLLQFFLNPLETQALAKNVWVTGPSIMYPKKYTGQSMSSIQQCPLE